MEPVLSLSIVVPLYNEQDNIEATVAEIHAKIGPRVGRYEIILVDDGSRDRTGLLADALGAADARLRVLHHPRNLGYGAALRSGFRACRYPLIFYTDGDLQFDLGEIDRLFPLLKGADIVAGYRIERQDPWHRRLNAGLYNLAMRMLFGVKLRDLDCAFKIYRRAIFETITMRSDGILVSGEILVQALRHGLVIREVGVNHRPRLRGVPTGNKPAVVAAAMLDLARFCWDQWWLRSHSYEAGKGSR